MDKSIRNSLLFSRRTIVVVISCGLLMGCGVDQTEKSNPSGIQNVRTDNRPNIIYILVDDLGYGDIGPFGQTKIKTPMLDQLAKEGMRFTEHYAGSTVCAPSRASLVTGKHTGNVQVRGNFEIGTFADEKEYGQFPLLPGTVTIGTMMQDAGYETALVGKWGLGGPGSFGTPNKQGFDHFFGYLDQKQAHNHYPTHLWLNEDRFPLDNEFLHPHQKLPKDVDPNDPASYEAYKRSDPAQARLTADALRYIKDNKNNPFFLYLSYAAPHAALQVPDAELGSYSDFEETPYKGGYLPHIKPRAARAAMISLIDKDIARVITLLKELNLDQNTLVIFTSDNGPSFEGGADMEFFDSNGPLRGYKRDLYEGGIRMPTIAWWPGKVAAGSTTEHMSAFWDIMPTLADLAGIVTPPETDGISFVPTLYGEEGQESHKNLYWEFHNNSGGHSQAIRFNDGKNKWKAVKRYTKANRINPPIEIYNLTTDIGEAQDVAKIYPELVRKSFKIMNENRTRARIDDWNFDYWPKAKRKKEQ